MAAAPLMPEAASLIGSWRLRGPESDCALNLVEQDRPVAAGSPGAPMMRAEIACDDLPGVVGWRPVPLGLDLTDADGRAVLTFEQTGDAEYTSIDQAWRLSRP